MITFSGPSRQRRTFRTDQSGSYVLGKTLINLSDELIYMRKTLIGSFNRNTCFERATERTKNRSQQVFPTHTDGRKKEERVASLEASLYARNAAVLGQPQATAQACHGAGEGRGRAWDGLRRGLRWAKERKLPLPRLNCRDV